MLFPKQKQVEGRKLMQLRVYGTSVSCNIMECIIAHRKCIHSGLFCHDMNKCMEICSHYLIISKKFL